MMVYWQIKDQTLECSGLDSLDNCFDKQHFKNYKKTISYKFNSWGCRDNEPPNNLNDLIWCVGDSFTLGLGQPFEETWPQLLEKKVNIRCMNIAQNGCPNDMIAIRANKILEKYSPKKVIILWSFLHRRFKDGNFLHFHKNNNAEEDLQNFIKNFNSINNHENILNYIIPNAFVNAQAKTLKNDELQKLLESKINGYITVVKQVDVSRDGFHFDIETCNMLVEDILSRLK
jgi:hypothetical protein